MKIANAEIYIPAPSISPIKPHAQRAADVVRPLIWFLELKRMEFPLIMAMPTTAAPEITGITKENSLARYISVKTAAVADTLTSIKVLIPAE